MVLEELGKGLIFEIVAGLTSRIWVNGLILRQLLLDEDLVLGKGHFWKIRERTK